MTDTNFLKGLGTGLSGIGSGANGIASAVRSIALLPYLQAQAQQRAKSQAAIQAYNEARTRDLNEAAARRAEVANALRENPNPMAKYLIAADFSNGDNLMRGIKTAQNTAILQKLIQTAGLADAQTDDTSPTGSIQTAQDAPPPDFGEMLTRTAQIQASMNGRTPYTKGQYGTILNAITGVLSTADPEARHAQLAKDRTAVARNQAQAEKARRAPVSKRGRAGGRAPQATRTIRHRTRYPRNTSAGSNAGLKAEAMNAIAHGADRATIAERYRQLTGEQLLP